MTKTIIPAVLAALFISILSIFINPRSANAEVITPTMAAASTRPSLTDLLSSAQKGDVSAQFRLGEIYMKGGILPRDYILSYMWFNLSSSGGFEPATAKLDTLETKMTQRQVRQAQSLSREFKK